VTAVEISTDASATGATSDQPVRVAVVIPCYNDGAFLSDAVSSVKGAPGVEVVVVDDGSTDAATQQTLDDLAGVGIAVVHQANAGLSAARMAGVRASTAPYIYNLDADDIGTLSGIQTMAQRLEADPDAAVCYGGYEEFGDSQLIRLVPISIDPYRLAYTNEYPVTAMFRRSTLEALGGWRHVGAGYEDWSLWMSLAERGFKGVHAGREVITFRRRVHGGRMLASAKANHRSLYRALRREHEALFADLPAYRRASELSAVRKLLYPAVYGARPRFRFESRLKAWLDRIGVWTLRG
jgi:glycosyltransferase involved in cell wall biosynthesis